MITDMFVLVLYLHLPPSAVVGPIRMVMPSMEVCDQVRTSNKDRRWVKSINCQHVLYDPSCSEDTCGWAVRP